MAFAGKPTPSSYRSVTDDGITLSIPARWPVTKPGGYCAPGDSELRLFKFSGPLSCPANVPQVGNALLNGVMLYASSGEFGPLHVRPTAVIQHGTTTVNVYAEDDGQGEFELLLVVSRAGSSTIRDAVLCLGRDGRVAGGVLSSIQSAA